MGGWSARALRTTAAAAAVAAAAWVAAAGESWTDPPFAEVVRSADAIVECEVLGGGQFEAVVAVSKRLKGQTPAEIVVTGFNAYERNNSAYYSMVAGERFILFLQRAGELWALPTPTAGKFPVDREHVVGSVAGRELRHETPYDDFVTAVTALSRAYEGKSTPAEAVAVFRRMLRGPIESRHLAIEMLGNLGAPEGAAVVAEMLSDGNEVMRSTAARALGRIGGGAAAGHLRRALGDASDYVAREAAIALAATGEPGSAEDLRKWLARTAEKVSLRSSSKRIQAWVDARIRVLTYVHAKTGPQDIPALEIMLASGEPAAAVAAVGACARLKALSVVPKLIGLAGADDPALATQALAALYLLTLNPDFREPGRLAAWWRAHSAEGRGKWVASALAAARKLKKTPESREDRLTAVTAVVSKSPDAVAALRRVVLEGEGWNALPIEELRGPLAAAVLAAELGSGSSFRRSAALKGLKAFVADHPGSGGRVARLVVPLVLDSSGTVSSEAVELIGECGARPERWVEDFILARMEVGGLSERRTAVETLRSVALRRFGFAPEGITNDRERALGLWREYVGADRAPAADAARPDLDARTLRGLARRVASGEDWAAAAAVLVRAEPKAAEAALLGELRPAESERAARVASVLAFVGSGASAGKLAECLGSSDRLVRVAAALAAGLSKCGGLEATLAELSKSDSGVERDVAVLSLGLSGTAEGAARLAKMLSEEADASKAARAAEALAYSRKGDSSALHDALGGGGERAPAALVAILARGEEVSAKHAARAAAARGFSWDPALAMVLSTRLKKGTAPGLAEVMGSGSMTEREVAGYMLSLAPHPAAAQVLRKALADSSSTVRFYAVRCLGKLRDKGSAEAIAARLDDTDSMVRAEAAAALGEIGDRRHYGALKSRLGAWLFVDARVYAALGALGGAEEVDVLLALTKTQNWSEQYYGMKGLARTRLSEAADRLAEVWLDGESQFQSHAAECLLEMGAVGVRRAGKALASDDPKVRAKAVQLLGRSSHPEARSALRVALEDPDERVRKLAKRALGKPRAHGRPKDAPARR